MTERGRLVRTRVTEISLLGRNTQGVRLIDLSEQESLISVGLIEEAKEDI
jgi:DNA gyrase subunit A